MVDPVYYRFTLRSFPETSRQNKSEQPQFPSRAFPGAVKRTIHEPQSAAGKPAAASQTRTRETASQTPGDSTKRRLKAEFKIFRSQPASRSSKER